MYNNQGRSATYSYPSRRSVGTKGGGDLLFPFLSSRGGGSSPLSHNVDPNGGTGRSTTGEGVPQRKSDAELNLHARYVRDVIEESRSPSLQTSRLEVDGHRRDINASLKFDLKDDPTMKKYLGTFSILHSTKRSELQQFFMESYRHPQMHLFLSKFCYQPEQVQRFNAVANPNVASRYVHFLLRGGPAADEDIIREYQLVHQREHRPDGPQGSHFATFPAGGEEKDLSHRLE